MLDERLHKLAELCRLIHRCRMWLEAHRLKHPERDKLRDDIIDELKEKHEIIQEMWTERNSESGGKKK